MIKKIWKYSLDPFAADLDILELPSGSAIIHVGDQNGVPTIWAEVPQRADDKVDIHSIYVIGTGRSVPDNVRFLGTAIGPTFVWHIYEHHESDH